MGWLYRITWLGGRFILFFSIRQVVIRPESADRPGPLLLACTHVSHLDPFLLSAIIRRPVDWMSRIEFFRLRPIARMLLALHAFPVNRGGMPVSAIRTAIGRLSSGRVVGICPEGGVAQGRLSSLRGGPLKRGVCLVSYRTGVPVLPVVILGTDRLNRVIPWIPYRRANLWVAFSDRYIHPRKELDRRAARESMAAEIQQEFIRLYEELRAACALPDGVLP